MRNDFCAPEIYIHGNRNIYDPHLPQVESDRTDTIVLVELVVRTVFGIVDLWVDPFTLVGGVGNLFWLPFTLKKRSVNQM